MSANVRDKKIDKRVVRSRSRLGQALIALIQQRPFKQITIQDVLDDAGVARATFYQHYRDKNDLLFSDSGEFFEFIATTVVRSNEKSMRLIAVKEFLTHLREAKQLYRALIETGMVHELMGLAQDHFASGIEKRLKQLAQTRSLPPETLRFNANALAGALTALISWWLSTNMRAAPEHLDERFHRLAWLGLTPEKEDKQAKWQSAPRAKQSRLDRSGEERNL